MPASPSAPVTGTSSLETASPIAHGIDAAAREYRFKIIYLEITNACNFTCDYCPIDQQTRKKVVMPKEFACQIIDQIVDNALSEWVTFHLMGEPFLHKDLCYLTEYSEARGLKVRLLTNGSLLETKRNRALFASNLYQLEVGFRTPNDTSFSLRLRGGNLTLEEYIRRVKELIDDKVATQSATKVYIKLFIRPHAAKLKLADSYEHLTSEEDNLKIAQMFQDHTLQAARALGRPTEAWEAVPIRVINGNYEIFPGIYLDWSHIQDFWVREQKGQDPGKGYRAVVCGCSAGFRDNFGILANGEVTTCCVDYDGKNVLGDLRKQTLMEVIDSPEARRVKRSLEWFLPPKPFCRDCMGGPTLVHSVLKQASTVAMELRARLSTDPSIRRL